MGWLFAVAMLAACFSSMAVEREFYFDRLDDESGLLQNSVLSLLQSTDGTIWVGTQSALHQFDGYRFRIFEHEADDPASLPDSAITALAETVDRRLWVGSSAGGVSQFDPATGRFDSFSLPADAANRNARETITALQLDPVRGLWIGSRGGLDLLSAESNGREHYAPASGGTDIGVVRDLLLGGDGELWVATSSGLWRVNRDASQIQRIGADTFNDVSSVFEDRNNNLYAGTSAGLSRVDPRTGKSGLLWSSEHNANIDAIVEDDSGKLWLAVSGQGLVILSPASGAFRWIRPQSELEGGLQQGAITRLLVDQSGLLWVGSDASGLSKVDPSGATFRYIADFNPQRNQDSTNNIRSILEDSRGHLWLGTDGDGLKVYDRRSGQFSYYDQAIAEAFSAPFPVIIQVEALAEDATGQIWLASNFGVAVLDPVSGKVTALAPGQVIQSEEADPRRRALIISRDGAIWFAGRNVGVVRYDPRSGERRTWQHRDGDPTSLTHNQVLVLYEDRAGRIWAGTADGLNLIDPASDAVRIFRYERDNPASLSSDVIRVIHESTDGSIWIGTHGGLNQLAELGPGPAHFERTLKQDGLPDATVYAILEDSSRRLWISSNRGIATLDLATRAIHSFSVKDGLQGQEFNGGAFRQLRDSRLAFGGIKGLNLVAPGAVSISRFAAPVVVSDVRVGNISLRNYQSGRPVQMAQADRVVHFTFAALDFTAPQRNQFRYQLEGFDEDWVSAGTRHEATYTNLDPGHYVFRVMASNHDGSWSENTASVPLVVTPAWWINS